MFTRRLPALTWLPASRWQRICAAIALAILVGAALVVVFNRPGHRDVGLPPTPPAPAAGSTTAGPRSSATATPSGGAPRTCGTASASPLGGIAPIRICIPSIHVTASVMQLGLNADRTVQVPPLSRVGDAGWYKYSAAPGKSGPTVILGHVDSATYGEGVFFRLGQLRAGDAVSVNRGDGRIATYRIDRVVEVSKQKFPTQAVYGPTSGPALRLVTCGGRFDAATGNYLDNIIAYGSLDAISAG